MFKSSCDSEGKTVIFLYRCLISASTTSFKPATIANSLEHYDSRWNYHKPKASNTCKTEHPHGDLKCAVSLSCISAAGAYTLGHCALSSHNYRKDKASSLQRSYQNSIGLHILDIYEALVKLS
jgi:hypothetical protein